MFTNDSTKRSSDEEVKKDVSNIYNETLSRWAAVTESSIEDVRESWQMKSANVFEQRKLDRAYPKV